MNLILINVSTRKLRWAVRLPEGDLPVIVGDGTSKSAASAPVRGVGIDSERPSNGIGIRPSATGMCKQSARANALMLDVDKVSGRATRGVALTAA
jgi:hypothetical protein